jgi:hypothetical protein
MDIPLIPSTQPQPPRPSRPRKPIPWLALIVGAVVCLALLMIIVPVWAQKKERATYKPAADARSQGEDLLNTLGAPPGCTPADFWVAERGPKRRSVWNAGEAWQTWTHPFTWSSSSSSPSATPIERAAPIDPAPKGFPSIAAWYSTKLTPKGWRIHRVASPAGAEFCKASWLLRLNPTASGYELKLSWDIHFTADRCQHP